MKFYAYALFVIIAIFSIEGYLQNSGIPRDIFELIQWFTNDKPVELKKEKQKPVSKNIVVNANKGDPLAQVTLGVYYEDSENYKEAVQWYKKAADQFEETAFYRLAELCRLGKGVPKDYVLAYMLFYLAEMEGSVIGREARYELKKEMTQQQIERARELLFPRYE